MGYLNASKAQEGISRGLFCYLKRKYIYVLHAFIKNLKRGSKIMKLQKLKQRALANAEFKNKYD
ncbi:TPA: type II toxin-antitoxin system RelE/ParE family toxin [Proteus mirabilis]|uniref:type II toxin-antitoxin system RelE/ParE family toxin n=1 Tax=Proteus mirabilis TaxID=584 RepID=UPI0006676177|nr:type II toxin-antitoxin system RelE/ParE family toxin [Proteus mirabilis]HCD1097192.1 type II toxin-antitoxin system RelE/ParE family toxin [Proteus mirabilis]HCD1099121.1 type II toxin-antitoxin system RelE/ParE family toxin [Proteus mirabilis]HCD1100621.1 type II toxin-antitoxin system RelE/ParE family toxin [Proteus mirabilis]HCT6781179.1 type II toxin-antitoxin system RelE/ParE family toxin [Proteus mirabilis]